jgi:hypothetical protein
MEYTIKHNGDQNMFLDSWENGGVWLSVHGRNYHVGTSLTREQAQAMLEALTKLLEEVTA